MAVLVRYFSINVYPPLISAQTLFIILVFDPYIHWEKEHQLGVFVMSA